MNHLKIKIVSKTLFQKNLKCSLALEKARKTGVEQHLLLMTGPPHPCTPSSCGCLHRNCTRSGQAAFYYRLEGVHKSLPLRRYEQLMVSSGGRVSFLLGCDVWHTNHTLLDSPTPRSIFTSQN